MIFLFLPGKQCAAGFRVLGFKPVPRYPDRSDKIAKSPVFKVPIRETSFCQKKKPA